MSPPCPHRCEAHASTGGRSVGAQPPECMSSATAQPVPSVSSSQPCGSTTRRGLPCRPRGVPSAATGNGSAGSSRRQQLVERGQRGDQRQVVAQLAAGGEALEVPRDVLAELLAALLLAHVVAQQLGVPAHHRRHLAERRAGWRPARPRTPPPGRGTATGRPRQPRPTTTPAAPVSSTIRSRRRPPRCRRCRAPGCRRARPARRSRTSRPARSRPGRRCGRAARWRRSRTPARSGRRRGR